MQDPLKKNRPQDFNQVVKIALLLYHFASGFLIPELLCHILQAVSWRPHQVLLDVALYNPTIKNSSDHDNRTTKT
jgi:hypothetical protein